MERVLIVSATEKSRAALAELLTACGVHAGFCAAASGAEARRSLVGGAFDLVLINMPLPDEFGHGLAQTAAQDTAVILLAKAESADAVAEQVAQEGVFVLGKPLSRALFTQTLHLLHAAQARMSGLAQENRRLRQRIEDIRLVDRAKCLLIELRGMTEPEAHAYIERQAMDRRRSKRQIAEEILGRDGS